MLRPALLYKEEILRKFTELMYTEDYYFYSGYDCGSELPNLEPKEDTYSYCMVDNKNNVIGYLSYKYSVYTDTVYDFGLMSFDKGNVIVVADVLKKLEELINIRHKVEWRVLDDNPVKRHYDKFCKKHGGFISHLHDTTKDLKGNYTDSYIYEIINKNRKQNSK